MRPGVQYPVFFLLKVSGNVCAQAALTLANWQTKSANLTSLPFPVSA
jgi:hypothetical protein